jgi:hypothetical protein
MGEDVEHAHLLKGGLFGLLGVGRGMRPRQRWRQPEGKTTLDAVVSVLKNSPKKAVKRN